MSLKFYADENLPYDLVQELKRLKYDVLTAYDAGNANQQIPDDQVLATATRLDRTVLTCNRRDFIKLHYSGVNHRGIILCKDPEDFVDVGSFLHEYFITQSSFVDRLLRVLRQNQRGTKESKLIVQEYLRS